MLGYINQLLPAMTGIMGVATVWADAGYLTHAGPLPLRFRVPPPPMVSPASAPVPAPFPPPFLPPYFPPVPIALPTPPMPSSSLDTSMTSNAPPVSIAATNGPALEFDARDATTPDAVVSAQMLLKYFPTSTNSSATDSTNAPSNDNPFGLVSPLRFNPPTVTAWSPAQPTGSKATYSTSP
jgi:hypothetical protein